MKYDLEHYGQYLAECEKSKNTIEKYLRDVRTFLIFSGERELSKEIILEYKKLLIEEYRTSSVNSMLIAVNGYLSWIGRDDLRVRVCRMQRLIFREEERKIRIDFKGKVRIILIPRSLLIILKDYCRKHKIKEGSIFRSRNGR